MSDVVTAIDRALGALCPCGAEPAEGSAYCCDDCRPTHIAGDTDTSGPGAYGAQSTAMRWRPDLITEVDDSHRIKIGDFWRGRFHATTFEYANSDRLHLRLDDGNRFVGVDVDGDHVANEELEDAWSKLERQLTDSRYSERSQWGNGSETSRNTSGRRIQAGDMVRASDLTPIPAGRVWVAPIGADPASPEGWSDLDTMTGDGIVETITPDSWTFEFTNTAGRFDQIFEHRGYANTAATSADAGRSLADFFSPFYWAFSPAFLPGWLTPPVRPDTGAVAVSTRCHRLHTPPTCSPLQCDAAEVSVGEDVLAAVVEAQAVAELRARAVKIAESHSPRASGLSRWIVDAFLGGQILHDSTRLFNISVT